MIKIICKECGKEYSLTELEDNLRSKKEIKCVECEETFEMENFEDKCPKCNMVYGVTPCHAFDPANVHAAGVDY